jgi:anti-sigma-K factor RskA
MARDVNHEHWRAVIYEQAMNPLTEEGIRIFQAGDKQKAARILARSVQIDSHDEEAWYWLSACVDGLDKKRYCLQEVLKINPENTKARLRLSKLEGFAADEVTKKKQVTESSRRSQIPRIGVIALAVTILVASFIWILFQQERTRDQTDLAVVLSVVEQADILPMDEPQLAVEPTESPAFIPVTGSPIVISGDGQQVSGEFRLPEGKLNVFWQYRGSSDEDRQLQAVYNQHQTNLKLLEDEYGTCLEEKQLVLDAAILRQKPEEIIRAEKDMEICIEEYQQETKNLNTQYYDAIDYYSTSFTVIINRQTRDERDPIINVKGIYYGKLTFEAEAAEDYYLSVDASGPWSITFGQ